MMYLEDYLEKLEHLPEEIKNQTSEIRQLDQQVKNSMDCIKDSIDLLFSNADTMHPDDLDADFKTIMKIGDKVLKKSDEKIQLANNMQKLMKKYMNKIDDELQKFEAELNIPKSRAIQLKNDIEKNEDNASSFMKECTVVDSNSCNTSDLASNSQIDTIPTDLNLSALSGTKKNMGVGCSVIPAAASKAIVATKKSAKRRKSASLKASIKAINDNTTILESSEFSPKCPTSNEFLRSPSSKKNKKYTKNLEQEKSNQFLDISTDENAIEPDNRRYCLCNEYAYSMMIGCDNRKCPHEWFHYECVGIKSEPHGKWYCPKCVVKLKRKRT